MTRTDPITDAAPAILDALSARGIASDYVPMHGIATLHITDTIRVNTGLHSWAYGSAARLNAEGSMFEPAEDVDEYAWLDGVDEDETDPELIAHAWATWAAEHFGTRVRVGDHLYRVNAGGYSPDLRCHVAQDDAGRWVTIPED